MTLQKNRDLMWLVGGRVGVAVLSLASFRIVTTLLTPEQYGDLALMVTVQMFCGLFLVNPVGQHINVNTHAWWDAGTLIARLRSYRDYVLLVSVIGGAVAVAVIWQHQPKHPVVVFGSLFAIVLANTWNTTLIPMLNMLGYRAESVTLQLLTAGLALVFSVLCVYLSPSASAWLLGQSIGFLIGAIYANRLIQEKGRVGHKVPHKIPFVDRPTLLSYCLPLALATGLMWLQQSGYRFVVEHYWGLAQLGLLVVGFQLASQISLLVESLATQFFYPMFYRLCSDHMDVDAVTSAYSDLINTLLPLYLLTAGLIAVSSQYIIYLLADHHYKDAAVFLMIGAGVELCRLIANLLGNAAHVTRKAVSLAVPYGVGASTALAILVVAGVAKANVIWAGYAVVIGAIVMLMSMWVTAARLLQTRPDWLRVIATCGALCALAVFWYYLRTAVDLRFSVVWLGANGFFVLAVLCALLWKNPATTRLLNVKAGKEKN